VLDFRRFCSDELLAAYVEQRDVLRAAAPGVPVTTNFVLGSWVPVDHARWAREVDLVAIDHYPDDPGPAGDEQTAYAADLARAWAGECSAAGNPAGGNPAAGNPACGNSAAGTHRPHEETDGPRMQPPWLLMESAPNLVYTQGRMHAKEPGRMLRHSLSHVARGSRGAMFFQWRAPRGGAEQFHAAMVPHAGPDGRVFAEVVELGATLKRIGDVEAAVDARAAILWDVASHWALQGRGLPSDGLDAAAATRAVHGALWRTGVVCDFAGPESDLSRYPLVLAPSLYIVSEAAAAGLRAYVAAGGTLVVWYFSGIVDPSLRVWPGGYPGPLRDILGVRVEEVLPLGPQETVTLSTGDIGSLWSECLHAETASIEATYAGGRLDGCPAFTRNRYGDGTAWYVSTQLDAAALGRFLGTLTGRSEVGRLELVRRRASDGTTWLFAINHDSVARDVPGTGVDLLTGSTVDGVLTLAAGGCAVLRCAVGRDM
jgi:beta-galactosidase